MKAFKYLICRQTLSEQPSKLDEVYWENFKILNDKTLTRWYVKYKPVVLKKHIEYIGVILKDKNINLIRNLKKYEHIDIPNDITNLCLQELETAEPSKRERVIKILVFFMSTEDFLKFFKQHIPLVEKVDIAAGDEDTRKSYEIQCALAKNIKSTVVLKQALPDLLKYCRGDVLGSALPSLYSSFCRIPAKQLYFALEELSTKAVSVRKHSTFLSSLILQVNEVLLKYKQIQNEKNASVKQYIFLSCYKYFLLNQIPECWPILEEYIDQLKKEQKEILKILTRVKHVPEKYRGVFIEHVWTTLSRVKKENVNLDDNMNSLLRNLNKQDVSCLTNEFCMKIIENNLFNLEKCSMEDSVFEFARNFLLFGGNTEDKITFIFKVLHIFKEKFWNDEEHKLEALKVINRFCFDLIKVMFEKKRKDSYDKNFPKLFRDAWANEFTIEETFEENLFMNFVIIVNESETESLSKQVNKAFSVALEKYGNLIISSFKNFISTFLQLTCKDDNHTVYLITFLDNFLEENCSPEHCALVIELLPEGYIQEEAKAGYNVLTKKLLQKDEIVKICLFGKLKSGFGHY
ncbi:hypothetical protein HHI36_018782 [Cryptolaemus montrouzieri]|uniref:Uncharacterized protein n=1 Tax=Cryptolaemus montrouzieri TaxID=559131 RepID=A0ABD2P0X6_9CUCU